MSWRFCGGARRRRRAQRSSPGRAAGTSTPPGCGQRCGAETGRPTRMWPMVPGKLVIWLLDTSSLWRLVRCPMVLGSVVSLFVETSSFTCAPNRERSPQQAGAGAAAAPRLGRRDSRMRQSCARGGRPRARERRSPMVSGSAVSWLFSAWRTAGEARRGAPHWPARRAGREGRQGRAEGRRDAARGGLTREGGELPNGRRERRQLVPSDIELLQDCAGPERGRAGAWACGGVVRGGWRCQGCRGQEDSQLVSGSVGKLETGPSGAHLGSWRWPGQATAGRFR